MSAKALLWPTERLLELSNSVSTLHYMERTLIVDLSCQQIFASQKCSLVAASLRLPLSCLGQLLCYVH